MTTYGLLTTGYLPIPQNVELAELAQAIQDETGMEVPITGDTLIGAALGAISERIAAVDEKIGDVYLSAFRETSENDSLDNAIALIGKSRVLQSHSTVTLTLSNTTSASPVTVEAGSQARQGATGVIWETTAEAEIPALTTLLSSLDIDDQLWQSGTTVRVNFNSTPNLTPVAVGDEITIAGSTNGVNDGTFPITAKNTGSYWVEFLNPDRTDNTDDETSSPGTASIDDAETTITVAAQSLLAGAYEATAGSINEIVTSISGWDGVTNALSASVGDAQELDEEARQRAALELVIASGTTVDAVLAALVDVTGVTYASGDSIDDYTDPDWGYSFVVVGGTDQAIWDCIGSKICGSIPSLGAEVGTWTDTSGNSHVVRFSRATEINPYLVVNLTTNGDYPADGDTLVQEALEAVEYELGEDIINHALVAAISTAGIDGILTIQVYQGTAPAPVSSANTTIAAGEVANITADRITVNS